MIKVRILKDDIFFEKKIGDIITLNYEMDDNIIFDLLNNKEIEIISTKDKKNKKDKEEDNNIKDKEEDNN